ncbi:MAG TPA: alpha/beta fold hydrolase [Acidimicrobiales bacterium]|nr:alpha/beta fold hydrolase [Acidimicrobiales bacterium]
MSLLGVQRRGSGPPLVWLHGFTQTKGSAHQFRSILAGTNELLTLDLPGHGENAAIAASLDETADLLAEVLPQDPFTLGGYSFGSRVALHFALRYPQRLSALVLLGASRGIFDRAEREKRKQSDDALAARIEEIGSDTFLDEWLAREMFKSLPKDPLERAARSTDASGLASSLRHAGAGTQRWLAPELASLSVPTLALAGALDRKFSLEATAIAEGVVNGDAEYVPDAHHAAHLEHPDLTAVLVQRFTRQF